MAKRKRTKGQKNDLQNITHETKDRETRIPQKSWVNSGAAKV